MSAFERGILSFVIGFGVGFFVVAMCSCSAEQRQGHRVEFSVDRMQLDADSASSSASVDGPGPHDAAFSSASGGGDLDGWQYGVAYSIPLGDDPAASEARITNAQIGGLRREVADGFAMLAAAIEAQGRPQVVEPAPSAPEPTPEAAAQPEAASEPEKPQDGSKLNAYLAMAVVALGAYLKRELLVGSLKGLFGRKP